jgi:hypothetical protein
MDTKNSIAPQPLIITPEQAKDLYKKADAEWKEILEGNFGKSFFKTRKPFNEITTMEQVFEQLGMDSKDPVYYVGTPDEIAYRLLKLIPLALNPEGWKPDWNDSKQRKWSPWFYMDNPGFRFSDSYYSVANTNSTGGSRLCYATEEISNHAAKAFLHLYKEWLS